MPRIAIDSEVFEALADRARAWHRRNRGVVHEFLVTASGCLTGQGGSVHIGPNTAARHVAGYPAKGWTTFKTDYGVSLADLAAHLPNNHASRA